MPAGPDDDPSSSGKKRHVPGYPDRHPGRVRLLQYRCRPEGLKAERNVRKTENLTTDCDKRQLSEFKVRNCFTFDFLSHEGSRCMRRRRRCNRGFLGQSQRDPVGRWRVRGWFLSPTIDFRWTGSGGFESAVIPGGWGALWQPHACTGRSHRQETTTWSRRNVNHGEGEHV